MSSEPQPTFPVVLVHGMMIMGIVLFTAVIVFVQQGEELAEDDSGLATPLALAIVVFALCALAAWILVRSKALASLKQRQEGARQELERDGIPKELILISIVGAAGAEGVGLFGVVGYLLTSSTAFLVAPALAILLILLCIPRRAAAIAQLDSLAKEY